MTGEQTSADRNRDDILVVLRDVMPDQGSILEIASGAGKHAVRFAEEFAPRVWQPSEYDPDRINAMRARFSGLDLPNLRDPVLLDARAESWPVEAGWADLPIRMIYNVNMIHIAPWEAGLGLLAGAGKLLAPGGVLYLYGPYRVGGAHTGPGNVAFDQSLRARDPSWGIRDLDDVTAAAAAHGLQRAAVIAMPADNLSVVFRRTS